MNEKPRILVVDDEPQLTRVLRTGLSSRGYDVRAAADGQSGFETFTDWHPDLVITDLAMPVMDGLTATRRIRALGNDTPLYIVSGNVGREDRDRCLEAGATGHIGKPLDKDQIHHLVQSVSA